MASLWVFIPITCNVCLPVRNKGLSLKFILFSIPLNFPVVIGILTYINRSNYRKSLIQIYENQRRYLATVNHTSNKKCLETLKMNSGSQQSPKIQSSDIHCGYVRSTDILAVYWIEIILKFFVLRNEISSKFSSLF